MGFKMKHYNNYEKMLIAVFLLVFTGNCWCQIVTANILQRVFLAKYHELAGTVFTIEVDSRQYIIGAEHVFKGIAEKDSIQIFHDKTWKNLAIEKVGNMKKGVDVIVFAPEIQISPTYEISATTKGIIIGQDVYFLGFPFGITNNVEQLNNYFPLPFIKKGILSTWVGIGKEATKILYIDGINNEGFSGGPIVFYDQNSKTLKIAGVISGYMNQYDKVLLDGTVTPLQTVSNSGLLLGYAIDHVIDAINKNPIGVLIK